MYEQLALLPRLLTAHLALSLFALLVGVGISVPLGVLASRRSWTGQLLLSGAATVQTIPALALLALMVPLLDALGLTNIGFLPAFIALVLYTVLPVLRNTVTGLNQLAPAVLEAARGVGMDRWQQLVRVELPLALPVIVAGIRTAGVWTVGAATLATPIGADSLGNFIFAGLQTRNPSAVLVGCFGAAALALALDGLGKLLLIGIEGRRRWLTLLSLSAFAGLYAYAGAALALQGRSAHRIVVGAKTFTEQYVLAELLAQQIRHTTGQAVRVQASLGSSVAFDALTSSAIDVYVDYSGTIWATVLHRTDVPRARQQMLAEIEQSLLTKYGVTLVAALGFENSYALAMRRERARQLSVARIGDSSRVAAELSIGGDYEFFARPEWAALQREYQLQFKEQRAMDPSLMYGAVASGAVDVIGAFSTDGRIAAYDLVVLEDERGVIPPYDALILASPRLASAQPEVLSSLRELAGSISGDQMRRLNLAVDVQQRSIAEVASQHLESWRAGSARP